MRHDTIKNMKKNILIIIIILILVAGGAYWLLSNRMPSIDAPTTANQAPVTSGENPQPGSSVHDLPVEPAAAVARKDLAAKLAVDEKSIVIMQITDETWSDGCLGLGQAHESCLQALVPGFKVEMLANGKTYFYRTDKTGTAIRAEAQ